MFSPSKKRKSRSNSTGGSSSQETGALAAKEAADASEPRVVTIHVQKPNAAVDPIVVSFPGGVPEHNDNNNKPKFLWRKLTPTSLSGRLLKGQDSDGTCQYLASCQGMGYDDRKTKLCVGVFDKKTNTLTLHQAASKGTVYTLQQSIPKYQETVQDRADLSSSALLFEDFGSSKKRKVLRSQKANKVDVSTVLGSGAAATKQLQGNMSQSNQQAVAAAAAAKASSTGSNKAGGSAMLDPVEAAYDEARRAMLPPFDEKATEAFEVYKPEHMVKSNSNDSIDGENEAWTKICKIVTACMHKPNIADSLMNPKQKINIKEEEKDDGQPKEEKEAEPEKPLKPPEQRGYARSVVALFRFLEESYLPHKYNEEIMKKQFRCALLLHYLITFYSKFRSNRGGGGGGGRGAGKPVGGLIPHRNWWFDIPRSVAIRLLETMATEHMPDRPERLSLEGNRKDNKVSRGGVDFSNIPMYVMTKANQDKCLVSILLVYLMAKGGPRMAVSDMTTLVDELNGLDIKEASHLLRQAGCTVMGPAAKKRLQVSLTVPLTFPKVKLGGKRKR